MVRIDGLFSPGRSVQCGRAPLSGLRASLTAWQQGGGRNTPCEKNAARNGGRPDCRPHIGGVGVFPPAFATGPASRSTAGDRVLIK